MAVDPKPRVVADATRRHTRKPVIGDSSGADPARKTYGKTATQTAATAKPTVDVKLAADPTPTSSSTAVGKDELVAATTTTPPRAVQLAALLAAEGTNIATARKGLVRALSTELLTPTSAAAEEQAAALFASLRAGQALDVGAALEAALTRGGPMAIAELESAFGWRVGAAAADHAPAALLEGAAAAGEALVLAGVKLLATRKPANTQDAVATMVAQSALLSGGHTADSAYYAPGDFAYSHHFDAFTNEQRLPAAIAKMPATGGAMVGVSGGSLQTAAQIRADAAVISDLNPEIRDFVLVMATALRVIVDKLDASGGNATDLLHLLNDNLLGPGRGNAAFVDELRAAGLPETLLARVPTMMARLYNESGMNMQQVWLMPRLEGAAREKPPSWMSGWSYGHLGIAEASGGTPEQVEAQVRAIAKLVGEGSLVAAVVDLSDSDGPRRVASFLEAKKAPVRALHLSNALDYVVDPKAVLQGLTQLPLEPGATVLSSCAGSPADRRIGDFYNPGVNAWQVWMEPGGIKERVALQPANWGQLLVDAFVPRTHPPAESMLTDPEATRAALRKVVEEHYRDPTRALASLAWAAVAAVLGPAPSWNDKEANQAHSARHQRLTREIPDKLQRLGVVPPKGPEEVRSLVRSLAPLLQ